MSIIAECYNLIMKYKGVIFDFAGTLVDQTGSIYKGVEEMLRSLRAHNLKIGIASRSSKSKIKSILEESNLLTYFDEIVSGEDVKNLKPDPECYTLCSYRLGLDTKECIAIEDSENGIIAAQEAGVKCIGITNTYNSKELERADFVAGSYEHLGEILEK